jgi:hypothetical protein
MSLTFNTKTYTPDSFAANSVGYVGAAKTLTIRDDLQLRRTAPKPTSLFSGLGRTWAKLIRTGTLTGALTPSSEMSVEVNVVVPVGYASADVDALLNDMGALVSSASFKSHVKAQQINF